MIQIHDNYMTYLAVFMSAFIFGYFCCHRRSIRVVRMVQKQFNLINVIDRAKWDVCEKSISLLNGNRNDRKKETSK